VEVARFELASEKPSTKILYRLWGRAKSTLVRFKGQLK